MDSNRKGTAVFLPKGQANLFLPSNMSEYSTVHPDLLADSETEKFLKNRIGIKEPSLKDVIYNKIFPQYKNFNAQSSDDDTIYFKKIFSYYMQIPINEHPKYFSDLKKIIWFRCDISYNPTVNYSRPNLLYIHTNDLEEYFKAADVLTKKIMDCAVENNININWIKSWLIRFGTTDDEIVEQNVFHEKTFDIRTRPRNVTVTTIARFPYDYFLIDNQQWHLYDLTWDYIIIDEASMIPLANIIFPLYKKQPERFYIAGDPHQIEPVIALDLWKDENIYTLVELNDFTTPKTRPHNYEVTKLTTQYRSIIFEFNFYRQK